MEGRYVYDVDERAEIWSVFVRCINRRCNCFRSDLIIGSHLVAVCY